MNSYKALYWGKNDNNSVRCELCPHRCHIAENTAGICGARENHNGSLTASGYGQISSAALDPIEKKPLSMFHPGSRILSIGGFGCNLRCPFCQNYEISMKYRRNSGQEGKGPERRSRDFSPDDIARLAVQSIPDGNIGVAYTYNEPLIGYEFLCDCARLVHDEGLMNVVVTNGYINPEPLEDLLPLTDAMNIDLKGFTDGFYNEIGGTLEPVKDTIARAYKHCHIEVTTLVIPEENDSDIEELSEWLASISPDIPLHLTRFFPRYRYEDRAPTPRETVLKLCETAKGHLKYVFAGNM